MVDILQCGGQEDKIIEPGGRRFDNQIKKLIAELNRKVSFKTQARCFVVHVYKLPAEPLLLRSCVLPQCTVLLLQPDTQVLQVLSGEPEEALRICQDDDEAVVNSKDTCF